MQEKATLRRVITLPYLVFYGVGTILGAGIYALSGKIVGISGVYAPFAFLVSAFIAAFVGLTYAELGSRFPKSAGVAIYVDSAFHRGWLTAIAGWGIVSTGVVSAAVMARGFHGYLNELVPVPDYLAILLFVGSLSLVALLGIQLSVNFAALITVIEIFGILLVLWVSREFLWTLPERWPELIPPMSWRVWRNILLGAFLAFYAYLGFEDMVNIAEEVIRPRTNLPAGIMLALLFCAVLFVLVALAAVLALPIDRLADHSAPFVLFIEEHSRLPPAWISLISLISILNGALVQIIMGSRVIYGMAEKKIAPAVLARIHPVTRTPVWATLLFSSLLLIFALWLPIVKLAKITTFIILSLFALVSLSLIVIKFQSRFTAGNGYLRVPAWVPVVAMLLCLGLIVLEV